MALTKKKKKVYKVATWKPVSLKSSYLLRIIGLIQMLNDHTHTHTHACIQVLKKYF
jgi:hypothetical protein